MKCSSSIDWSEAFELVDLDVGVAVMMREEKDSWQTYIAIFIYRLDICQPIFTQAVEQMPRALLIHAGQVLLSKLSSAFSSWCSANDHKPSY